MSRRPEGGSVIMRSRAAVTETEIVGEDDSSLPVTAWWHNESKQLATVGTTTARVNRLTQTFSWSKLKCFTVTHGPSMDPGWRKRHGSYLGAATHNHTTQCRAFLFCSSFERGESWLRGGGGRGALIRHTLVSFLLCFVFGKTTDIVSIWRHVAADSS